jgi:hypothetical protein
MLAEVVNRIVAADKKIASLDNLCGALEEFWKQ